MSNNISYSKWIVIVTLFVILNFVLLGFVNYIVDPFRVFGSNILPNQVEMNERFVKIEYLKKNNHKFNAYLFGSSRIGVTEPKTIEQYIPNSRFYNFTLSSANLYDYQTYLEFFIKKKYPINTLYLQLDLDDMNNYRQNEFNYSYKLHPEVDDVSTSLYYMQYLFGFFPLNVSTKIRNNINDEKTKRYQIDKGTWTLDKSEASLIKNCKKYVEQIPSSNFKNRRINQYRTKNLAMKALKNIVELCNKHNIKLYVFTTPHNQNKMDTFVLYDYSNYLKNISDITSFYDFTGYSSVTEDDCNYYEMSHYRPHVAKLIAGKIFNDDNINVPNDFGKYINKGSIYDKK